MKNLALALAVTCLLFVRVSVAQVTKGSILTGGAVGYTVQNSATSESSTASGVTLTPIPDAKNSRASAALSAGYFIKDGLAIGGNVGYTSNNRLVNQRGLNETYYSWNNITRAFQIGIFATKYLSITEKFYFTCGVAANFNAGSYSSSYLAVMNEVIKNPSSPTMGYEVYVTPGLSYFFSKNWGLSFKLNNILDYSSTTTKTKMNVNPGVSTITNTNNQFSIAAGLSPSIGINYVFAK